MKIYTKRGDEGETGLLGGVRVPKTDPRVEAYGSIDELNASLGLALALDEGESLDPEASRGLQADLFTIGSRLAAAEPERARRKGLVPELGADRTEFLEAWIDRLEEELPSLDAFILPGGGAAGAQLHVSRTLCRRAERATVRLAESQPDLRERVLPYLNRLSDLLFMLARAANHRSGRAEPEWEPVRRRKEERSASGERPAGRDGPE